MSFHQKNNKLNHIVSLFVIVFILSFCSLTAADPAQDWYFDQEGFTSNQTNQFGMGEETINLFNGNLILSYIDLHLPGNNGNDLIVQRVYNSKTTNWDGQTASIIADSWVGLGWTLHMGRLYNVDFSGTDNPYVEMPDGSRHMFYPVDFIPWPAPTYRSKDFWQFNLLDSLCGQVITNDGTILTFNRDAGMALDEDLKPFLPLISIRKPNYCDPIWVFYDEDHFNGCNLSRIQIGGEYDNAAGSTQIYFHTEAPYYDRLTKISYTDANGSNAEIIYNVIDSSGTRFLESVTPPVGPAVSYTYNTGPLFYELATITNPYGGTITYSYATELIPIKDDFHICPNPIPSRAVIEKTYSGDDCVDGTWGYDYPTAFGEHYTEVTDPNGNVSHHYFYGFGEHSGGLHRWEIGLNFMNKYYQGSSTLLKTENISWDSFPLGTNILNPAHMDPPLAGCPEIGSCLFVSDCLAKIPKLVSKTITLHSTSNTVYHSIYYDSYDDYGNCTQKRETSFNTDPIGRERKTVNQYAWQQSSDTFCDLLTAYIVSPLLSTKIYDVVGTTETLNYKLQNEYYLDMDRDTPYNYYCKFGQLHRSTEYPIGDILTTEYTYDDTSGNKHDGNLHTLTDPRGHTYTYAWQNRALKSITTPTSPSWKKFDRTIDANTSLVQSQQDPNGNTTSFTYDAIGRLLDITYPIENPVSIDYNEVSGEFDNVTTTRGNSEVVEYYDELGRVKMIRKTASFPNSYSYIHYGYDALGRKTFESEPRFTKRYVPGSCPGTYYQYDALGRVTEMTNPDGTYTYTYEGDRVIINLPNSETKEITNDPFGNIVKIIDEGLNVYSMTYNALNKIIEIDGPGTNGRSFSYDNAGRLIKEVHPESGQTRFVLDQNGNREQIIYNDDSTVDQTFDEIDRILSKTFSVDGNTITFDYDGSSTDNSLGQMIQQTFSSPGTGGSISYNEYDELGKILEVEYGYPAPVGNFLVNYQYDNNSNNNQIEYPIQGYTQNFTFNDANQVSSVNDLVDDIQYNAAGGISLIQYSNGITTSIPTDPSLRNRPDYIHTSSGSTLMDLDYTYDPMGNISEIERFGTTASDMYFYDEYNRMYRVEYEHGAPAEEYQEYTFDIFGNQLSFSSDVADHPNWSRSYVDNKVDAANFTYDSKGSITHYTTLFGVNKNIAYGYDNRVTSVTVNGGTPVTMAYDGFGQRINKTRGSSATWFMHSPDGKLLSEIDENGVIKTEYIYAGNLLIGKFTDYPFSENKNKFKSVPPEVSPSGSAIPFDLVRDGTTRIFSFQDLGPSYDYHIYGLLDGSEVDTGNYAIKFCDLRNNYFGSWYDDGSLCEWTFEEGDILPFANYVVIAENLDGEGSYGYQSDGTEREKDTDGITSSDFDCGLAFYTYHLDHLGSVRMISDENGNIVWPADFSTAGPARYTPFGELYKPLTRSYDGDVLTSLQFTSKERDPETQLSYFGARYLEHEYPPRFITADPSLSGSFDLENPQTFNLYTYSYNNPINLIDPTGEIPIAPVFIWFTAVTTSPDLQMDVQMLCMDAGEGNWLGVGAGVIGIAIPNVPSTAVKATVKATEKATVGIMSKATKSIKNLLASPKMADHHIFPQQFKKFFESKGIDIHKYTISLAEKLHLKGVHGKGIGNMPTEKWNAEWLNFIADNPKATAKDLYQKAGEMLDKYDLSHVPIHPYKE